MEPIDQSRLEHEYFDRIAAGDDSLELSPYWGPGNPIHGRDLARIEHHEGALHRAATLIEQGIAPPPEMLWVILDCYREYLDGAGRMTLEQAMLGQPQKHVGTMAARRAKNARTLRHDLTFALEFRIAKQDGLSDNKAAARAQEVTAATVGWAADADSWLRQHRRAVKKRPRLAVIRKNARTE